MPGILYLVISTIFGRLIRGLAGFHGIKVFASASAANLSLPAWTFHLPFDLIAGTTILTTLHYFLAYMYSVLLNGRAHPLLFANIVLLFLVLPFIVRYRRVWMTCAERGGEKQSPRTDRMYIISVTLLGFFGAYLMFYSFFVKEGIVHSGFSVFSDFAPHTAVIHSFTEGVNFPTEYPHFAGDGINYHFFFFYLCANLRYLGLPLDVAVNLPSILGMMAFCTLLGVLGVLITGRRPVFLLAPLMLFFRSSNAIFPYLRDVYEQSGGDAAAMLAQITKKSDAFIGNMTVHDTWGFWAMNVYANQRHLLWGFSVVLILVLLFYPAVIRSPEQTPRREGLRRPSADIRIPFRYLLRYLTMPGSWRITDYPRVILAAVLLVLLPYWHGSMFITALCVLFVMALFSTDRLSYLIAAFAGGTASLVWTKFFSGGAQNVANPKILFGFLSADTSVLGVLNYIYQILGVAVIVIVLAFFTLRAREKRVLIAAFLSPLLLAFTVSLTPDVGVNHKYILAAYALGNIFVAGFLCELAGLCLRFIRRCSGVCKALYATRKKRKRSALREGETGYLLFRSRARRSAAGKIRAGLEAFGGSLLTSAAVVVLCFCLFATGWMDLIVFHNKNRNHFRVDLHSPLISWIKENTDPQDVFLTDHYSMHEFFFSGRKILYGWPYYTWSAGHDTASRKELVTEMLCGFGADTVRFLEAAKTHRVRYAIIDNGLLRNQEYIVDTGFFDEHFEKVLSLPEKGGIVIYRLYDLPDD